MSWHHRTRQPRGRWAWLRNQVFDRDGWKCIQCGSRYRLECAHVVALSKGGEDVMENLRTLCRDCHIAETRDEFQPLVKGQAEWGKYASASEPRKRRIRADL